MFQKIRERFRLKELNESGVFVGNVSDVEKKKRALICLIRGIAIFFGSAGTILGLLNAFNLEYNAPVLVLGLLLISLYVAFLYYNRVFFYVGYFLLLTLFYALLAYLFLFANSGYQAIINQIYSDYSDYFKLLSVREGAELIEYRYVTITVASMFMGTFLSMLLNVTISGYMNLFESVLVTFPILEIAFFIGKKPPMFCLIMVLTMYIFVGVLQLSRHQRMLVKGKHSPEYARFKRKGKKYYFYQGNAKGNLISLAAAFVLAIVIGLFSYPSYNTNSENVVHNPVRKQAEEYVKIFVQSGFTGFFERYDSTGGMNSGRLGGVPAVRPDFEPDLSVTFAPYTFSTVYLKGFTGSYYSQSQWHEIAYLDGATPDENPDYSNVDTGKSEILSDYEIKKLEEKYLPSSRATARMNVVNLDADPVYSYLPYFSNPNDYDRFPKVEGTGNDLSQGTDITYAPFLDVGYNVPTDYEEIEDETYRQYIYTGCLTIPDDMKASLENYTKENDYFGLEIDGFSEEENAENYESVNAYRIAAARKVYAHFVQNFSYTMAPGTTPYNRDYVEYFLTEQKRGYCAHFATSGVMLLRTLGVPARYVEGYCIPPSAIAENAAAIDEPYSEWYEGDSLIEEEGVVNIKLSDSLAHAWIEIYLEGYGFVPFEMTPPSEEEQENGNNFADLFSGLFNFRFNIAELPDACSTQNNDNEGGLSKLLSFRFDFGKYIKPLLIGIGVIFAALSGFYIFRRIKNARYLKNLLMNEKYSELVYLKYTKFTDYLASDPVLRTKDPNPLPKDVRDHLIRLLDGKTPDYDKASITKLFDYIESTLYSKNAGTKAEYDSFLTSLEGIRKTLKKMR